MWRIMSNKKGQQNIKDILNEKDQKVRDQKYNQYVETVTPKHSLIGNCIKAFIVGGIICLIGQILVNWFMSMGMSIDTASSYNIIILIGSSIILTGFNIYPWLCKWGGAGTIVPITGFANSVAAPAIEYKKEGQVFGIGCKIFTIAGPVILYGILSSWLLGIIYYIVKLWKGGAA